MLDDISYCGAFVKEHDPDRFFLSMLCASEHRPALWALFAFNYEIAKTRDVVSETQLGLIRLQWWRDALEGIYERGDVLEHQVLEPLSRAIKAYDLPKELFDKLIYAREFDLEDVLPSSLEGVVHYADYTHSPLVELALMILGVSKDAEPYQEVAINYALAGILRSVPHLAAHRRCLLAEDIMKEKGQSVNRLYEYKRVEAFPEVIRAVAQIYKADIKPSSRYLRASQRIADLYMKQLAQCGYDPFDARMQIPPAFKSLRVWLS